MEVHHHSHTARKKWTHYFWEFLMLFLAVFCGFLAENQREHYIEHQREKQFMRSLINDLAADTSQLARIRGFRADRLQKMDSLIVFFVRYLSGPVPVVSYTHVRELFGHNSFYQSNGTLEQLKNAGGLRLVRHRNVVDSIESYDQQVRRMFLRDQFELNLMIENSNLANKLFDGKALLKLYADTVFFNQTPSATSTVQLNPAAFDEYLNSLQSFRVVVDNNMRVQAELTRKAKALIDLIKKEYHFK